MNLVCIIPARNEGETIANVVRAVLEHPAIARVVVSDSASTDDTASQARNAGAEVIHMQRPGKAQAMSAAVQYVEDATHFLFLDADLIGFTKDHISQLLTYLQSYDMVIGVQDRNWFANFFARRIFPRISGQRIVPRELWEKVPVEFKVGYRIELALNFFAAHNAMKVAVCTLGGLRALIQERKRSGVAEGVRGRYYLVTEVLTTLVLIRLLYYLPTFFAKLFPESVESRDTISS